MATSAVVRKLQTVLWLLFCAAVITAVSFASTFLAPSSQHYTITETYLVSVRGPDTNVHLGIIIPKDGPYQEVELVSVAWSGGFTRESSAVADVIKLGGEAKRGHQTEAVIEYRVILTQGKTSWEAPLEQFQCNPQHNIESEHPIIQAAAASVVTGNSRVDARKLYWYTGRLLSWPEESRRFIDASALTAFNTGVGSCGEFANLMVALCRASDIPSQTIMGLLFPEMGPYAFAPTRLLNHPGESHAWTEFFTGGRWEMADPSCASSGESWLPFGWSDGRHVSYGEAEQLAMLFGETREWAETRGNLIGSMFGSLKFAAAAESDQTIVTPRATLKKGWDGRWLNLLLGWSLTMCVVQRLNVRRARAARH
jgi:hypothetical protein